MVMNTIIQKSKVMDTTESVRPIKPYAIWPSFKVAERELENHHSQPQEAPPVNPASHTTMKFGYHLLENVAPEYGPDPYLEYDRLDGIIRELSKKAPSR